MRFFALFLQRPVGTSLLCLALALAGALALRFLPVAPLPQVDLPMIMVSASLPGASPETMASSVAMPLEQSLGAIAGLDSMNSRSREGQTTIVLVFDLDRDINSAARDVQAAINAARPMLPSGMRDNPTYRKVNSSSSPIMTLALTSDTATRGELYDLASTVLAQKLAQVNGVGQVTLGGSSLPAVRVLVNPRALESMGIPLDRVRQVLQDVNSLKPGGLARRGDTQWQIHSDGQLRKAADYAPLIVAWRDGRPVRLSDVARIEDSVEDTNQVGYFNDRPAVLLIIRRQADANIIETVDAIRALLPAFQSLLPDRVRLAVAQDRTPSIRASLSEAELTLVLSVVLVVAVVLVFLGDWRAALIPAVAVPVSLVSTFSVMWWFGFTLNTISLMALIVATGFVVDDAIVVLENIMRYIGRGMRPARAALRGVTEVGFTVLAMSLSLIAVFIPLWLVGGLVGRLFKEFAVTLSVAIVVSLLVSVTLTPVMAARLLRAPAAHEPPPRGLLRRWLSRCGQAGEAAYRRSLRWSLDHGRIVLLLLVATIGVNVYLYASIPKGFFPQQDTGQLLGFFRVDTGMSFDETQVRLDAFRRALLADPAVDTVTAYAGGRGGSNSSFIQVQLKPLSERTASASDVVDRLRPRFEHTPGARMFLVPQQDIFVGHSSRAGSYSYMLMGSDLALLSQWLPRVRNVLAALPELVDVDDDVEDKGRRVELVVDRDAARRLGVQMADLAGVLNNAFSQRQAAVLYGALNQYHVVMAVQSQYARDLHSLRALGVLNAAGERIPLTAFTRITEGTAPRSVHHEGLLAADSVSFGLAPGVSLDQALTAIDRAVARIGLPTQELQAGLDQSASMMRDAVAQQPWMLVAALAAMYLVLGMLYESTIHPVTILSTLPSAGIGALLALRLADMEFTLIALIGVFLLIGIVKKNAIMMVDFALQAQRCEGLDPREAIYRACLARLRPILMTTLSAMLGALPLLLATGAGVEMRQPLGLTIFGGLLVSQVLTLYTTPVVYLSLDRLRGSRRRAAPSPQQEPAPHG
ncbi:efflux RND transporter permease subunit [Castellaniella denitrificans]|uniref:Efflux RND transporter permease subunit n=1 Tax=Castellaniella denitrificans TaxID=56119 RepID=A0ABT4M208_9BURK|nr:efflux RND transporter permease subunit [Castellaniella denitrificans]MCZ4329129.1 efflux RND transporter permease subunit [Castellaniella denitrificans]